MDKLQYRISEKNKRNMNNLAQITFLTGTNNSGKSSYESFNVIDGFKF
jgi:DNA mismatch repair ATPase MutS